MNKSMLLVLAFVGISVSSCKKETIVSPSSTTINITANKWVTTNSGGTYTTSIAVPDVNNYYQTNGAVLLYNYLGNNEFEQLPNVYQGITYRFTFSVGYIYIDAQSANGSTTISAPPTLNLKLVLVQ